MKSIHLKLSDEELSDVDKWKDSLGIRTRSEALRQMIRRSVVNMEGRGELDIVQGLSDRKFSDFVGEDQASLQSDGGKIEGDIASLVQKEVRKAIELMINEYNISRK